MSRVLQGFPEIATMIGATCRERAQSLPGPLGRFLMTPARFAVLLDAAAGSLG